MKEEESKFFTTSKFSLYRFRKKRIPAKTFSNFLPPCDVSSQSGLIIIFSPFSLFWSFERKSSLRISGYEKKNYKCYSKDYCETV